MTRVSNSTPVHIEHPCINIIGTTQTKRIHELLKKGFEENGLLDRILFVLPKSPKLSPWINRDDDVESASLAATRWEHISNKVLALDYDTGAEERTANVLSMDKEAKEYFFAWWNKKVERINRIEDDAEVDSREMKHPVHVARLALIIQVLRYASDESHLQFVDMVSVKAAIRLNEYFEDSYVRIRSFVANDVCEEPPKVLLSLLPDTFGSRVSRGYPSAYGLFDCRSESDGRENALISYGILQTLLHRQQVVRFFCCSTPFLHLQVPSRMCLSRSARQGCVLSSL